MHQIGMFARHFVVVIEFFYIDYNTNFLKTLLFQNKKPFSGMPKGWKCLGSPCWTASELFL
jgi:hypothetical protein